MAFDKDVIDAITKVAQDSGIEPASLLAVVEVESGGKAHSTVAGKEMPLILYEYHVFYRWGGLTDAERSKAVKAGLAAKKWGALPYASSQTDRYRQLEAASMINEQAAYAACSWGVGQVLGENAEWLGYGKPKALAEKAMEGVGGQVEVMLAFIRKAGLMDELKTHDWSGFARGYNGAGAVGVYGPKIAAAYKRHAGSAAAPSSLNPAELRMGDRGEAVAQLQRMLRGLGYMLVVDADFGTATKRQVTLFQADQALPQTGIATVATLARLEALAKERL